MVNFLQSLQQQFQLAYLFIAHDLSMVKYISDWIGVMYKDKLVELAEADERYYHALHPYTESLLSAVPLPDPIYEEKRQRIVYQYEPFTGKEVRLEVVPGHFVYAEPDQLDALKAKEAKKNQQSLEENLLNV